MQVFRQYPHLSRTIGREPFLGLLFLVLMAVGCKKTITKEVVYDNVIYDIDTMYIYSSAFEKTKQKSDKQYISILYADLFKQNIPSKTLADLEQLKLANGDKNMANELIISSFMNTPGVQIPTDASMRANIDAFINDTFIRFYQRKPTEYERYFLKDLITKDTGITPELIYFGFAVSNEYLFY